MPGEPEQYNGLYCENGLIKSVNEAGDTMYIIRPDGSGFLAGGAIKWEKQDGVWNAEFNGIINAIGGVFSGYIRLPFVPIEDSDAIYSNGEYLLSNHLNVECLMDRIALPTDVKYAGSIISILNNAWPPYTKTFTGTYIKTQNGEKIFVAESFDGLPADNQFLDMISVSSGVVRLIAVLGHKYGSPERCIRWVVLT